jgi:hypothetical protein
VFSAQENAGAAMPQVKFALANPATFHCQWPDTDPKNGEDAMEEVTAKYVHCTAELWRKCEFRN